MARKFLVNIDLNLNELLNPKFQQLGSDPGSPVEGQFWYNTTSHLPFFRTNAATVVLGGRLDQLSAPTASVSLNSQKITNLLDPTGAQDAATKAYVDAVKTGLDVKDSVRVATTAAGTLATSFENGDTIDGVVLATGNRILIKDQATGAENGIYTVNASGAPTRAIDADANAEVTAGLYVFVTEGTTNGDSGWVLTTNDPITVGTTALTFAQFTGAGMITAGAGLTKTGNVIDVVSNNAFLVVNADNIDIGTLPVNKGGTGSTTAAGAKAAANLAAVSMFAQTFGDGAATSFNIDHNFNTLDVVTQVYKVSDGTKVEPDITISTVNRVILAFATAPASNEFRVRILGVSG